MRIAPRNFATHTREGLSESPELRHKFVMDSIRWAKEFDSLAPEDLLAKTFQDYKTSLRLRRVLKQLAFSETFDPATLEAFVHLAAPPAAVPPGKPEADTAAVQAVLEQAGLRVAREPVQREAAPRAGVQTWGGLEFVRVPKGRFLMGSKEDNELAHDDEKPQRTVEIPYDYWIGRFPVTNEQYNIFVVAEKKEHPVESWQAKKDHPVINISWDGAIVYCQWLNKTIEEERSNMYVFRLPTEAEWEKAARGEFANEWPWGNEWDPGKCNSQEAENKDTTPVGKYSPQGDSPFGVADMAGNAWEYTHSLWKDYPYNAEDGREDEKAVGERVVRGGAYNFMLTRTRTAARYPSNYTYGEGGFRIILAPSIG